MAEALGQTCRILKNLKRLPTGHFGSSKSSSRGSPEEVQKLMIAEATERSECDKCDEDDEEKKTATTQEVQTTRKDSFICLTIGSTIEKQLSSNEATEENCDTTEGDKDDFSSAVEVELITSKALVQSQTHATTTVVTINQATSVDPGLVTVTKTSTLEPESSAKITDDSGSLSDNCSDLTQHFHEQAEQDYESIPTCRICHCDGETEPLISPCLCTGTVKHIHHSCLMDWLKRCVKTKCELCLQPISVNKKTKPLKQWRRPGQKPTPIIWLLTFVVALTLNIASIAKDGSQKCVSNPCIIFYVVGAVGALLGFAFFYHFLIVTIRYLKQWMALNEDWTLVGMKKPSGLGNANLALSDKSLGEKEQTEVQMVEIV